MFTNPAGMTMLDHSQLLVGLQPIYTHLNFAPDNSTNNRGTDGGNALVPLPSGSFFYVYSVNSKLKFGFASCAYFGGALEYNLNWVGRYFLQGATVLGMSFIPAVAYRVNDWLSVGGGVNVMVGISAREGRGKKPGAGQRRTGEISGLHRRRRRGYRGHASTRRKDPARHYLPDTGGPQFQRRSPLPWHWSRAHDTPSAAWAAELQR